LSNVELSVKELDIVDLMIYRKTNIGFAVIINNTHLGMLHSNDIFRKIDIGDKAIGFIKKFTLKMKTQKFVLKSMWLWVNQAIIELRMKLIKY